MFHFFKALNICCTIFQIHEPEFPNLAKMARDFLAVPGTGVPVEWPFFRGSDLLSSWLQRLSGETIKQSLCLENWLKNKHHKNEMYEDLEKAAKSKIIGDLADYCV